MNSFSKNSLVAALLTVAAVSPALAQGEPTGNPAESALQGLRALEHVDGQLVGVGEAYKVHFVGGGMQYTPALGESAPRNLPLSYTFTSARRGAVTLETRPAGAAARDGCVAVYDRGSVVERFDVRPDGVEVTYTFMQRPAGKGDLVVRSSIATELSTDFRGETTDGLRFLWPELGGVSIGGVTGIDANGVEATGSVRFDGTHVEFVLPESFVLNAAYPMVLDPVIGTEFSVEIGSNVINPDVAYDVTEDVYLVAFELRHSVVDSDVIARRILPTGAPTGGAIMVALGAGLQRKPTVGNVNLRNRFIVGFEHGGSALGPFDVRARAVHAASAAMGSSLDVAVTAASEIDPDLSNGAGVLATSAVMAWNPVGGGIRAATLGVAPDGTLSIEHGPTSVSVGVSDAKPAISKGGSVGRYVVAWQRQYPTSLAILVRAVDEDSVLLNAEKLVADVVNIDEVSPDIDGDGTGFVVVFERQEGIGAVPSGIYARRLTWNGADLDLAPSYVPVRDQMGVDERTPAIAWCGQKYFVAWSMAGSPATPFAYHIFGKGIDPDTCAACGPVQLVSGGGGAVDSNPAIASMRSAASVADEALTVFSSAIAVPPFASTIRARRYEALIGGAVSQVRAGCIGGGTASLAGLFAFGNNVNVNLSGADPLASLAAVHIGTDLSPIVPCFSCPILEPFVAIPVSINNGNASMSLSIDCSIQLQGQALRFQYVVASTSTAPCLGIPAGFSSIVEGVLDF